MGHALPQVGVVERADAVEEMAVGDAVPVSGAIGVQL
jgi:hypothetical protein